MTVIESAGVRLHYQVSGNEHGQVLMLANSLGSNLHMWDKVAPFFEQRFRLVRYDMRGHGLSNTPEGPYTIDDFGRDVLHLLDEIGIERANFCGLSLGGVVAMWLGIHAPQRIERLIMANTGAKIGSTSVWDARINMLKQHGMKAVAELSLTRWFKSEYRLAHPDEMAMVQQMVEMADPAGYSNCCALLRDTDLSLDLGKIGCPCLVISGTRDPATPPEDGRALHQALLNSKYLELDASHFSAWEREMEFDAAVEAFLQDAEVDHG